MRILQVGEVAQGHSHSTLRCCGDGLEISCSPCIPPGRIGQDEHVCEEKETELESPLHPDSHLHAKL